MANNKKSPTKKEKAETAVQTKPKRTLPPPVKLTSLQVRLTYLGIVAAIAFTMLGSFGLAVMMDFDEQKTWYSQTKLGHYWRWAVEKNAMTLAACFNGGLFGLVILSKKLVDHSRAKKAEGEEAQSGQKKTQ